MVQQQWSGALKQRGSPGSSVIRGAIARSMRRSLPPAPSNTFWSARNRLPATQPAVMQGSPGNRRSCVTSSGPGAANLITSPGHGLCRQHPHGGYHGQVNSSLLGRDVFQEADMRGATESFVKYSYLVKNPDEIPRIMKEAFYIASTGRKARSSSTFPATYRWRH